MDVRRLVRSHLHQVVIARQFDNQPIPIPVHLAVKHQRVAGNILDSRTVRIQRQLVVAVRARQRVQPRQLVIINLAKRRQLDPDFRPRDLFPVKRQLQVVQVQADDLFLKEERNRFHVLIAGGVRTVEGDRRLGLVDGNPKRFVRPSFISGQVGHDGRKGPFSWSENGSCFIPVPHEYRLEFLAETGNDHTGDTAAGVVGRDREQELAQVRDVVVGIVASIVARDQTEGEVCRRRVIQCNCQRRRTHPVRFHAHRVRTVINERKHFRS